MVTQGQYIGRAGDTGVKRNPDGTPAYHLHFVARFTNSNGVIHSYIPEPMSGYTGFGNPYHYNNQTRFANGIQPSNVIQNGDSWQNPILLENGGVWQRDSQYTSYWTYCCGPDGNNYLELHSGPFGSGTLFQDFPALDSNWSNYPNNYPYDGGTHAFISTPDTWTVRALIRSSCGAAQGTLAVWAQYGPTQEVDSTHFQVGGVWTPIVATTKFLNNGHNRFRVIMYMESQDCYYDIDNVTFQRNYVNFSSFETGVGDGQSNGNWILWATDQPYCQPNWAVYSNSQRPSAIDGEYLLEANRGNCTANYMGIYQPFKQYVNAGEVYYMRGWVRMPFGQGGSGYFRLWTLWRQPYHYADASFWIPPGDTAWHEYTVSLPIQAADVGNDTMYASVYLNDVYDGYGSNIQYNFDGIQVWGGAGN